MICRIAVAGFALAYAAALALLAVGTWGLLGAERDPLSGVYLLLLGLPWSHLADRVSVGFGQVMAFVAPAVNLGLLVALCAWRRAGR